MSNDENVMLVVRDYRFDKGWNILLMSTETILACETCLTDLMTEGN